MSTRAARAELTAADYDDDARPEGKGKLAKNKVFAEEYEKYLRRELPPMVQRDLESEVETQLNCVENSLKIKAVEIFRNVQLKLLRTFAFQATAAQADPPDLPEKPRDETCRPKSPPKSTAADLEIQESLTELRPAELFDDQEYAGLVDGDFDMGTFLQMRLHQPSDLYDTSVTFSDSGYGSLLYSLNGTETTM